MKAVGSFSNLPESRFPNMTCPRVMPNVPQHGLRASIRDVFDPSSRAAGIARVPSPALSLASPAEAVAKPRPAPRTDDVQILQITENERSRILDLSLRVPSPYDDFEAHASASFQAVVSALSPQNLAALRAFRTDARSPGAILLRGLPTDPTLPATPSDGRRVQNKETFVSEACLSGVSQIIGDIYGYTTEKEGELIHNVCPVRKGEKTQSNESSKVDLSLHVENVYFDFRPDFVALYCLRQDHEKEAFTFTADARTALSMMRPEEIEELQQPVFVTPSPPSHHAAQGGVQWSRPRPLIDGPADAPELLMHLPDMKCLEPSIRGTFEKFKAAMNDGRTINGVALQPGDLTIVNNRKAAHGRCFFTPRYDGTDRWLQRVYLHTNLWSARAVETEQRRVYTEA